MKIPARPVLVLLTLMLAASLLVNVSLIRRARSYYALWQYALLQPLGLSAYPASEAALDEGRQSEPLVVFFGDSRAQQWADEFSVDFSAPSDWQIAKRGLGGQTSEAVYARLDPHVLTLAPEVIVLQAGVNDLRMIPLFPEQERAIINRCRDNLSATVRDARTSGATVVVTTIIPLGPTPLRPLRWQPVRDAIEEVNAALRDLAGNGVIVLETGPLLGDSRAVDGAYAQDWLHLNEEGYAALTEALRRELAEQ